MQKKNGARQRPPARALWELTHRCDLRCGHCLVSGGEPGRNELDTREALDLVDQLAVLGVRYVTLTGGDPLLRPDWHQVARAICARGMVFRLSTHGHRLDQPTIATLLELPTEQVLLSIDGLKATHDKVRHGPGDTSSSTSDHVSSSSFERVLAAIDRLRDTPVLVVVITAVNRLNLPELPEIQTLLKEHGVGAWIVQLAHATGRAAYAVHPASSANPADDARMANATCLANDAHPASSANPADDARTANDAFTASSRHPADTFPPASSAYLTGNAGSDLLLHPEQLEALAAFLRKAVEDPVLPPMVFNSIGYLSREEPFLRPSGRPVWYPFWRGCSCGITSIGIEPDGGIKGCANQVGAPFVVGNIRKKPLRTIWEDRSRWFWLRPDPSQMSGECASCPFNRLCGAGCTALAYSSTGELFNQPYCLTALRRKKGERR